MPQSDGAADLVPSSNRDLRWCILLLAATVVVLVPLVWPEAFLIADPASSPNLWGCCAALLIPAGTMAVAWMRLLPYGRSEKIAALACLAVLSAWCVDLHYTTVDLANFSGPPFVDNVDWQQQLHAGILHLERDSLPHSYRFLPDCIVAWIELLTRHYLAAALIYRLTFQFLLLLSVYRLARRSVDSSTSLVALCLFALAYPPSIRYYAGQLTDPMSHLSFVLAALCLEPRRPWLFFATVVIGVVAKESVLVMPGYACLIELSSPRRWTPWLLTFAAGLGVAIAIRSLVVDEVAYQNISNLEPDNFIANLQAVPFWTRQTWNTIGMLALLAALRWRTQPLTLRRMALYLAPCLWLSNLFLSTLLEARNFIPAAVPLAIMAAHSLIWQRSDKGASPEPAGAGESPESFTSAAGRE